MSERHESFAEAVAERDITLALTPSQLIFLVIGVWLLLRIIRGLRRP